MSNTKRKRAVVLALIAFFCGATGYVAVDWKRVGGGFLAFFKHKSDPVVATGGAAPAPISVQPATSNAHPSPGPSLQIAAVAPKRHTSSVGGGSGGHKGDDDDLFKYGDPAAGGIPPGSFVMAQNDVPGGGKSDGGAFAAPAPAAAAETAVAPAGGGNAGGSGGGGVSSPAPAPGGINVGSGDGGVGKTPTPAPSPASTPPASPAPAPTQSGTSDQNPGDGGGDPTNGDTPPATPTPPVPPVSAVPEASNAAMLTLGALFLAVAATRQRKNRQG